MNSSRPVLITVCAALALTWLLSALGSLGSDYVGAVVNGREIAAVDPGSPAEAADVRAGDRFAPSEDGFRLIPGSSGKLLEARLVRGARTFDVEIRPTPPPAFERAWRITLLLAGLSMILLALWVYRRRAGRDTALFLLLSLCLAVVIRPTARLPYWIPAALAEWVLLAAEIFFPALLLHFVLVFPPGPERRGPSRRQLIAIYLAPLLIPLAAAVSTLLGLEQRAEWAGALHSAVAVYFLGTLLTASLVFLRTYRSARTAVERSRLRVVLGGTVIGLLPVAALSVVLLWVPISRLPWSRYVGLSLLLVPGAFADAALRRRLFDFEVVFKRSLVYSIWAALSLTLYVLLSQLAGRWLSAVTHLPDLIWPALAVFLGGLLFMPTRERLYAAADRIFELGPYDYRRNVRELTREFQGAWSTQEMVDRGMPALSSALELEHLCYFEANGREGFRLVRSLNGVPQGRGLATLEVPPSCRLAGCQEALPWDLDTARWSGLSGESRSKLDSLGAAALVPVRFAEKLQGLWILGPRRRRGWYEPADLPVLGEFGQACGRALDHHYLQGEVEAQAHLKRDLAVAHDIQRLLVPLRCPIYPTLDLASESVPCQDVGGDYFDFVPQGEERFGFVIADSSGKGVPAALLMAGLQAQFRAEAARHPQPAELLDLLNSRTAPADDPRRFVSLFYAVVDIAARTLRYANGGHPPPLLVAADGTVRRLPGSGFLLGVIPEARYEEEVARLSRGDLVVFFTDGLLEERRGDELFGDERLEQLVASLRHLRCHRLVRAVLEEVQAFAGHALSDDVTLVAMKFL